MNDENILQEFQHTRRLKPQTMKGYKDAVRIYTTFNTLTLEELLDEAMNEEKDRLPWIDRTLKKRLEDFRTYLYDNYSKKTARIHFGRIKTIYLHYYIEIHKLPEIQAEDKQAPISYKDLPTVQILRKALNISEPMIRALILFMVSSGCAKKETRHLTIQDFIDATSDYHNKSEICDVINALKDQDDIVPIFHLYRHKTKKWFYTCCTPEATEAIIHHLVKLLNNHANLQPTDRIFNINKDYFNNYFKEINTALGLGKVRNFNRFTSHMLRRYHASALQNDGLDKDTVNTLQGKGQNPTDAAYFKVNPVKLKEKYMEHMHCLYVDFDIKEVKPEAVIRLENENKELKLQNQAINDRISNLEKIVLGNISTDKMAQLDKIL
jgi:integrase